MHGCYYTEIMITQRAMSNLSLKKMLEWMYIFSRWYFILCIYLIYKFSIHKQFKFYLWCFTGLQVCWLPQTDGFWWKNILYQTDIPIKDILYVCFIIYGPQTLTSNLFHDTYIINSYSIHFIELSSLFLPLHNHFIASHLFFKISLGTFQHLAKLS